VHVLMDRSLGRSSRRIEGLGNFVTAKSFSFTNDGKVQNVKDWGEVSMDRKETLASFIQQGMCKFPADKYILWMSGRGSGLGKGFGFDVIKANRSHLPRYHHITHAEDSMSIATLQDGLRLGLRGKKLAVLAIDASLLQNYGVAKTLGSKYTEHYVGSQESATGFGRVKNFEWMK